MRPPLHFSISCTMLTLTLYNANIDLKARIRTSGDPYYHQFNRLSFIIFSLLPTKANYLPSVISVLSNQHRSLEINLILEHRTLVLSSPCGFYRFWIICGTFAWTQNVEVLCIEARCMCNIIFHFFSIKFEIPTFCLYRTVLVEN